MIPAGLVRFCTIKKCLGHIFQTGAAAFQNPLEYKERVIKFHQIIVCRTGIHALCRVMF